MQWPHDDGNEMLSAAEAFANNCTLVTDNEREFLRIGDRQMEYLFR